MLSRSIVCVLRSGGMYNRSYAENLKKQVERFHPNIRFLCFTDMFIDEWTLPLVDNWEGWWSKIEIFNLIYNGAVIYLDLDTALFGSLDPLFDTIERNPWFLYMRRPTKKDEVWASGVMGFYSDFGGIYNLFKKSPEKCMKFFEWDQRFITHAISVLDIQTRAVQDVQPGVVSYKKNCLKGLPEGARVVCFHGRPRPHEVGKPYFEEEYS